MNVKEWLGRYDGKKEAIKFAAALCGVGVICGNAYSEYPVRDVSNWIENFITRVQAIEEVRQTVEAVRVLNEQLSQARAQYEALTGARHYGRMLEGGSHSEYRRWMPNDWNSAASMAEQVSHGGIPPGLLGGKVGAIATNVRRLGDGDFRYGNFRPEQIYAYKQQYGAAVVSGAIAEQAYNDGVYQKGRIEALAEQIDQTPDLKASIDLNNKLQAETLYQLERQNQLKAVEMKLNATMAQQSVASQHATERFLNREDRL